MKIGFIGLGTMGLPMAINLVKKSGCPVVGYDVVEKQCQRFRDAGGATAETLKAVFSDCGIVFLSLPSNELVRTNLALAVESCARGTIVVDTSSSYPAVIQGLKKDAEAAGIRLIDCPVSGGEQGARNGTLAAMCGGEESDVTVVRPYLEMFASVVTHMGPLGCGYAAKLANNLIVGTEIALIAEVLNFAEKAGLDQQRLFDAMRNGAAGSAVLEIKAPKMIQRDYTASSRLSIHLKDQHNALRLAEDIGAYTPLCDLATGLMDQMERNGHGTDDVAVMLELFEQETRKN